MTNPNLGASVDVGFLRQKRREAEEAGEEALRGFHAKHLNVEIDVALREGAWAGARVWAAAAEPGGLTLDELLARSEVVTVGIDGGGLDDLLGLAVLGRERDTRRWLLWSRAWAHESALEQRKSEAARLRGFAADGDLAIVSDLADANAELAALVKRIHGAGLLAQVGVDLWGTSDPVDALAQEEIAGDDLVVGIQQGWRLNGAWKALETRLASKSCAHGGRPLMAWCAGNAKAVRRGNAVAVEKAVSGTGKIDPLVAAACAAALMVRNPEPKAWRYEGV